jgi:hypothetical protein
MSIDQRPRADFHKSFVGAIADAVESQRGGGEVVAVWERAIGRVFVVDGKIAWVVATSLERTLGDQLVERAGFDLEEVRAVFQECREQDKNFAECLVERGLADRETIYAHLLEYGAEGLLEILSWPEAEMLLIPHARSYQGTLLFSVEDMFRRVLEIDGGARLPEPVRLVLKRTARLGGDERGRSGSWERPSPWDRAVMGISRASLNIFEELEDVEGFVEAALVDDHGRPVIARVREGAEESVIDGRVLEVVKAAARLCTAVGLSSCHLIQLDSMEGAIFVHPVSLDDADGSVEGMRHIVAHFSMPINAGLIRARLRAVARKLARRQFP